MDIKEMLSAYDQDRKENKFEHCYDCKTYLMNHICLLQIKFNHASHDVSYCGKNKTLCPCPLKDHLSNIVQKKEKRNQSHIEKSLNNKDPDAKIEPKEVQRWRQDEAMDTRIALFTYIENKREHGFEHIYYCKSCLHKICAILAKFFHASHDLVYIGKHPRLCDCGFEIDFLQRIEAENCRKMNEKKEYKVSLKRVPESEEIEQWCLDESIGFSSADKKFP